MGGKLNNLQFPFFFVPHKVLNIINPQSFVLCRKSVDLKIETNVFIMSKEDKIRQR